MGKAEKCLDRPQVVGAGNTPFKDVKAVLGYEFKLFLIREVTVCRDELLLLLLSHFSRVRLCVTPKTAAHQAPLFLGFSRQEYWSGLPFPSPMHESEK